MERTAFGVLFLLTTSFSGVGELTLGFGIGRPNVLYCAPVVNGGIGLSVMLLVKFVFDGVVDMLNGRLFTDTLLAVFVIVAFDVKPALVAGFDDTVTGVTVTDEFTILRGNVGEDVAGVLGVEFECGFGVICCGAFGKARR